MDFGVVHKDFEIVHMDFELVHMDFVLALVLEAVEVVGMDIGLALDYQLEVEQTVAEMDHNDIADLKVVVEHMDCCLAVVDIAVVDMNLVVVVVGIEALVADMNLAVEDIAVVDMNLAVEDIAVVDNHILVEVDIDKVEELEHIQVVLHMMG